MNILISLLFSFLLLFGGKPSTKTDERVLAHIEIVQIGDGIYIRTNYDSRVFTDECSPKRVIAKDYLKSCVVDTTIKTKTKKL